ncbi:hypothetical protein LINPERPRIM_LOCUS7465 [Linum perenne]
MDSLAAVEAIRADTSIDGRQSFLIRSIQECRNRDWEILFHVFREANQVAVLILIKGV